MNDLVYPRERTLATITLILGLIAWLLLIVGTFGVALLVLALGFLMYLFSQSALIAHIKGNGVELSKSQFPDLYAQFVSCCERLQMPIPPKAYILNGDGGMNAFATQFLGKKFVVLLSDVVDAMDEHADGVRFYIGHELGHLRMKHLSGHLVRWPALWLPLLGAAYSRARESTCDRHGLACSSSPEGAARALAALSSGAKRWQQLDIAAYRSQIGQTSGFWMSLHELVAGYPWTSKRAARVLDTQAVMPPRSRFAYFLALFVPYAGRLGAGFGMIVYVYVFALIAAVAIPAYQDYTTRATLNAVVPQTWKAREALGSYYEQHQEVPDSLESVGIAAELSDGFDLSLGGNMSLTVQTTRGQLVFTPSVDDAGKISWSCSLGAGQRAAHMPPMCRAMNNP